MLKQKIVAIHQPNYLPYLGFFHKIRLSDVCIIYDDAQLVRGRFDNRQRIRTNQGWMWLTVPLKHYLLPFNKTEISKHHVNGALPWNLYHWTAIESSYRKAPFFDVYSNAMRLLYKQNIPDFLSDWNMSFIDFLTHAFQLRQTFIRFSSLEIPDNLSPSEKLAQATHKIGGTVYLSGPSGKNYLNLTPFKKHNIEVRFTDFHHPVYTQYHTRFTHTFEKNMAAIDALFNVGLFPD